MRALATSALISLNRSKVWVVPVTVLFIDQGTWLVPK